MATATTESATSSPASGLPVRRGSYEIINPATEEVVGETTGESVRWWRPAPKSCCH